MNFGLVPIKPRQDAQGPAAGGQIIPREDYTVTEHRGRPPVTRSTFHCQKCRREPKSVSHYFAQTSSVPSGPKMTPEEVKACGFPVLDCGEGYVHGWAECHGARAEFYATFAQAWLAHDAGQLIRLFDLPEGALDDGRLKIEGPRQPLTIDI